MKTFYRVTLVLVIIGALNWGMIGIFNIDLVKQVFGDDTFLTNFIYSLIGICGLISIGSFFEEND